MGPPAVVVHALARGLISPKARSAVTGFSCCALGHGGRDLVKDKAPVEQAWRNRHGETGLALAPFYALGKLAARKRKLAGKETKNFYALAEIRKIHAAE